MSSDKSHSEQVQEQAVKIVAMGEDLERRGHEATLANLDRVYHRLQEVKARKLGTWHLDGEQPGVVVEVHSSGKHLYLIRTYCTRPNDPRLDGFDVFTCLAMDNRMDTLLAEIGEDEDPAPPAPECFSDPMEMLLLDLAAYEHKLRHAGQAAGWDREEVADNLKQIRERHDW